MIWETMRQTYDDVYCYNILLWRYLREKKKKLKKVHDGWHVHNFEKAPLLEFKSVWFKSVFRYRLFC